MKCGVQKEPKDRLTSKGTIEVRSPHLAVQKLGPTGLATAENHDGARYHRFKIGEDEAGGKQRDPQRTIREIAERAPSRGPHKTDGYLHGIDPVRRVLRLSSSARRSKRIFIAPNNGAVSGNNYSPCAYNRPSRAFA
ncbi:hypothetical protein EVAR_28547_1 [Eumeta japonica]|uniref:Uncharacterized protein n=1 Tax=Eumeta variegata TaxID=151549 RepID=A0A4C1UWU0_EUMVA|nr:hypothetical protein EVAR_28547_1 [Eumeta japonica]